MKNILFALLALSVPFCSCQKDDGDIPEPKYPLFLIIVEDGLLGGIDGSLETYISETARGDSSAKVIEWSGASAKVLRDTIIEYFNNNNIIGALLIGDLPYVKFEMDNWDKHEEFPCDLYYGSPSTDWHDYDGDSIYDDYSSISIRYFVSRIMGTETEINQYFDKVHNFRTTFTSTPLKRAMLFVDNDWSDIYVTQRFSMDYIYSSMDIYIDTNETTRQCYSNYLTSSGAEYVMQLIHASYLKLYFDHLGQYETMSISEMTSMNPKARFYNLFDCSACNFEYDNLGMSYVMNTSYGLAVMGTTKTGGNYYPQSFNEYLADGGTWGESWVYWWNTGASSLESKWTMGLVIFGDPMLKPNKTATKAGKVLSTAPDPETIEKMDEIMMRTN